MSYLISLQNTGSALTLQIKANAESGTYAGIRVVRSAYGSAFSADTIAARTCRAYVEHISTTGFDVELIHLRKVIAISDGDSKSQTIAYYTELHVSKTKAVDSSWTHALPTAWFPINGYLLAVNNSLNFSMFTSNTSSTSIQLYEVDPVSKARQIYDSV